MGTLHHRVKKVHPTKASAAPDVSHDFSLICARKRRAAFISTAANQAAEARATDGRREVSHTPFPYR